MSTWRVGRVVTALLVIVMAGAMIVWKVLPTPDLHAEEAPPNESSLAFSGEGVQRYEIMPGQSEARYRVREQLAGVSFFQDAVGVTRSIQGEVVFDEAGMFDTQASAITIDLTTLRSDESRRDNFVRNNTLQTGRYPEARFVPIQIRGLPDNLPDEGTVDAVIVADLTIRDVTKRQEWPATISFESNAMVVDAKYAFTFGDFNMTRPRVAVVLSVDDEIRLEANIRLNKVEGP